MNILTLGLIALVFLAGLFFSTDASARTEETSEQRQKRLAWWKDARFGMFIHFGVYSEYEQAPWLRLNKKIPKDEYHKMAAAFNPSGFDAARWVADAKQAGMKYIVITSKHHDGFALFDSKVSDFTLPNLTPFKRDLIKELADACEQADMRFGVYYSQSQDWDEEHAWGNNWDYDAKKADHDLYLANKAIPQIHELTQNYGKLSIFWFDTPMTMNRQQADKLEALVRSNQPGVIINNRLGNEVGDYHTPESVVPPYYFPQIDWEACTTMGGHWGYSKAQEKELQPAEELLQMLIDIVSKNGNLLLNISPRGDGTFPSEQVKRLELIGEWMQRNSESIYGAGGSFYTKRNLFPFGRITTKSDAFYVHLFSIPSTVVLKDLEGGKITRATILGDPEQTELQVRRDKHGVMIDLPARLPVDGLFPVIKVEHDGGIKASDSTRRLAAEEYKATGPILLESALADWPQRVTPYFTFRYGSFVHVFDREDQIYSWDILSSTKGPYNVFADYAALDAAGGRHIEIEILPAGSDEPSQTIPWEITPTGHGLIFETRRIGQVELDARTSYRIIMRSPKGLAYTDTLLINLRSLQLAPAPR